MKSCSYIFMITFFTLSLILWRFILTCVHQQLVFIAEQHYMVCIYHRLCNHALIWRVSGFASRAFGHYDYRCCSNVCVYMDFCVYMVFMSLRGVPPWEQLLDGRNTIQSQLLNCHICVLEWLHHYSIIMHKEWLKLSLHTPRIWCCHYVFLILSIQIGCDISM